MAHYQLPDRGARDFYEDAPRMSHSDVNAAKLPIGHIPESGCYPDHEEQEANNDRQRCQAVRESLQPEAQLLPFIVPKMSNFMMTECHGLCV